MSNKQQISFDASMRPPKMTLTSITRTARQARRRAYLADSSPESPPRFVQDLRAILRSDDLSSLTMPEYSLPTLTVNQRLHRILQDAVVSTADSSVEDLDDEDDEE